MHPPEVLEFLSSEEKGIIPIEVSAKIAENITEKSKSISLLHAEIEKSRTNSDQQKFQLERELITLQKLLEDEGQQKSHYEHQLEAVQKRATELDENLKKSNERINKLLLQLELSRTEQESTSSQSATIAGNLESRERLITELKNQIISLEEQLVISQKGKYEAIIKSEEAHGLKIQFQYKERRHEQEKSMMTRQMELLQSQLEERAEESLTLRNKYSCQTLNSQFELNTAMEEARILKEERDAQQKIIDEKTAKIHTLLASVKEATESEVQLEDSFRQELAAMERLCTVYKDTSEDQQRRCDELDAGVSELRQLLQQASEQYGAMELAKKNVEQDAQEELNKSNLLIKELKEEVTKVNNCLQANTQKDDALLELSPAASAASHLMKKGLTLSQLYTEYMNATDKLFEVEDDNKRLNRYVNQILQEIQEKAPVLNKQLDDYHRALETIDTLHTQVDNSIEELEKQRQNAEDSHRRASFLGRENERFALQIKDLSKQVTILLTQVDAARSGLPAPPISVFDGMVSPTCAADVISDRFVAFRDVSELQQQNTQLIASLRAVTEKAESAEKIDSKTSDLQDELKHANSQLDDMQSSREKLQNMIESLIKQRDLYKTMSANNTMPGLSPTAASTPRPRGIPFDVDEVTELKKALTKVKDEYEEYRKERGINADMENAERKKLREDYEKFRRENIKLISQAEYNEERMKTLNINCEALKRQLDALENKCGCLQGSIGKHESTIDSLREQCLKLSRQLSHAEALAFNLREEKSILKENEARLVVERESLHQTNVSQTMILSNLELIKNNLERTDFQAKMRLDNQISDLTTQNARLKSKIESNGDLQEAQLRLVTLEEQLKLSKEDALVCKAALAQSEAALVAAKAQMSETPRSPFPPGMINRPRVSPVSSPGISSPRGLIGQSTRELEVQLGEERAKTQSLQATVGNIQQKNDQLKSLCTQQETQLAQASKAIEESEQSISKMNAEANQHNNEFKTLTERVKTAEENEIACRDSLNHQIEKISQELQLKEDELSNCVTSLEEAKKIQTENVTEAKQQQMISTEARDKYEREVMLHAADLKALSVLKEKLSIHNEQLDKLISEKEMAENTLTENKIGLDVREAAIKKSNDQLKNRLAEMEAQNKTLLDQFTQLSDKMASIQTKLTTQSEGAQVTFTDDEARTTDQLREVIKYLRREKELSVHKVEVAQAEAQRLEAQKKSVTAQLESVTHNLAEERLTNQASMDNVTRSGELMRKVQTVDALSDSNKLLREEKDSLKNSLDEVTVKANSLQEHILPLQEKLRELNNRMDSLLVEKRGLEDEKERFRKRTQELVEKLNRAKPEDMIKLQKELSAAQSSNSAKDSEINRLKNFSNHLQKTQQAVMANKNQLQSQLDSSRDESKRSVEEGKRMSQEKQRLQQQILQLAEKTKSLESLKQQTTQTHQADIQKAQEQIADVRQKEEARRIKEMEALKRDGASKIKDLEDKNEALEKQTTQLRKIATKYKRMAAEAAPESSEAGDDDLNKTYSKDERMKMLEERVITLQQQLEDQKGEQIQSQPSVSGESNVVQSAEASTQGNAEDMAEIDETGPKMSAYQSKIVSLEKDRQEQLQTMEILNKKLNMQQKQLENLQKQSSSTSKASTSTPEKPLEAPPTANIKPMAAPAQPALVRSQASSQIAAGQSPRSIPTASIRPLTPSAPGQGGGASAVGVVSPLEALSGDGAVSSTVTLPQATVTPTPAVPTSIASVAFPPTLTATVSPTPVSSSIAGAGGYPQQFAAIGTSQQPAAAPAGLTMGAPSGTAGTSSSQAQTTDQPMDEANDAPDDALISQAIAMVSPQIDEDSSSDGSKDQAPTPSGSSCGSHSKRKLDASIDEEGDSVPPKRYKQEVDSGEPSSSSMVKKCDTRDDELIVIASDDEDLIQTSERAADDMDHDGSPDGGGHLVIASVHGGSEAELRLEQQSDESRGGDNSSDERVEVESSFPPPPERSSADREQPSSSRQSFPHFSQIGQFEEVIEDRLVPSTPTLVIQPPLDGQSVDGVSSLRVPTQDFVFGTGISQSSEVVAMQRGGLAQISEGEIIDVTRVDLGQLEDSQKVPMVPSGMSTAELTSEGSISSSAGEGSRIEVAGHSGPSGSFMDDSADKQEEPDSGVDESEQRDQDVVEIDEDEETGDMSDDQSRDTAPDDSEENLTAESVSTLRATRSTVTHSQTLSGYEQPRRIRQITWNDGTRPFRGSPRGREMQGVRGQSPRFPAARAAGIPRAQRARRTRGAYGRGQM